MSYICLVFDSPKNDDEVTDYLDKLAQGELIFVTRLTDPLKTPRIFPHHETLAQKAKYVGSVYWREEKSIFTSIRLFGFGDNEPEILNRLAFENARFSSPLWLYLKINNSAQELQTLLNPNFTEGRFPPALLTNTQGIMNRVAEVRINRCRNADDYSKAITSCEIFKWRPPGQEQRTKKEAPMSQLPVSQPTLNEEKCQKALEELLKQCENYKKHVESEQPKKTAKLSALDKMIEIANKKNSTATSRIMEFDQQFHSFKENFKTTDNTAEAEKAKAKFRRRVAYALLSVGIYALVRGYQLGTFKFWKSHKQVLAEKVANAEKELGITPGNKT